MLFYVIFLHLNTPVRNSVRKRESPVTLSESENTGRNQHGAHPWASTPSRPSACEEPRPGGRWRRPSYLMRGTIFDPTPCSSRKRLVPKSSLCGRGEVLASRCCWSGFEASLEAFKGSGGDRPYAIKELPHQRCNLED